MHGIRPLVSARAYAWGAPGCAPASRRLHHSMYCLCRQAYLQTIYPVSDIGRSSLAQVKGHIIQVDQKGAHVDVGGKSAAFVPNVEMALGLVPRVCGLVLVLGLVLVVGLAVCMRDGVGA